MSAFTAADEKQVRSGLMIFALAAKHGREGDLKDATNVVLSTVQHVMEGQNCRDRFCTDAD